MATIEKNLVRVNPLPVLTWHKLHMNAGKMEAVAPQKPCSIQAEADAHIASISPLLQGTENSGILTGSGTDIDSMFQWGMTISVPASAADTIRIKIGSESEESSAIWIRVQAEANSALTLVQIWNAQSSHTAVRTVIHAEAGAHVRLIQLLSGAGESCINDVGCVTEANASLEVVRLYTAKSNILSGIRTNLAGNGSNFSCKTGYLVQPHQKLDMNVIANHIGKNTTSDIHADGTLYDNAKKIFRGTIDLRRGGAGADGKEEENVLLLGDNVVNQTIPLILCTEEDVKGSHGASIGELEPEMLFYFEARGICKEEAEKIVAKARLEKLCQDVLDEKTVAEMHHIIDEVI